MVMASVWSWVTYSVAAPIRRCTRSTSARICTRSFASRLDSGSSIRKMAGSRTIARPMATRCRCPPDSCRGLRPSMVVRPRMDPASRTRRSRSAFGIFRFSSANAMFWATVRCGYSA